MPGPGSATPHNTVQGRGRPSIPSLTGPTGPAANSGRQVELSGQNCVVLRSSLWKTLLISWDLGVIHRHEREADLAAPPRPEGRNHRIQRRRDRLHGPKSIDHGRGARRHEPDWNPPTLPGDGRRPAPTLPRDLAPGETHRHRVRLSSK